MQRGFTIGVLGRIADSLDINIKDLFDEIGNEKNKTEKRTVRN